MTLQNELAKLLGPKGWLSSDKESYETDWLKMQSHQSLGVARPCSTAEVSSVLKLAHEAGVPVIPQGGNTSLCAGAVPEMPGHIIISLNRMNKATSVDPLAFSAVVEAGVVLAALHERVQEDNLAFPMHLGAEGSAQIGGLISTNAGGSHALRYGMMQDLVLGLEVVLPNGQIWNGLRPLVKDNAGYQLRRLFCGAEGTLGIITRAALRLHPAPVARETALLAIPDLEAMVRVGARLRHSFGEFISALEFFADDGLAMVLNHVDGIKFPLENHAPAYILLELSTSAPGVDLAQMMETALSDAFEASLITDGTIAANDAQRAAMWKIREEIPEGQRREGPQIKHDIAVPVASVGRFIMDMAPRLDAILPGVRINPFGHLGDGNIHYNLSPPEKQGEFGDHKAALSLCIYEAAEQIGGSFAAEHGLGRTKVHFADQLRDASERQMMQKIKFALDPQSQLNPGVILTATQSQE
ncbi:FAD-binding oxidoreductase [Cochlodiniinecator piscidefendens]|uniref:FAD-binding oxidoreductase n=1 Tax=Cochlodiniinecator piscidefendens TaxID=2715756 RepID=UPI00140C7A8D|nr:FAD-binding oxidoreductase [Cochlodiniinecator piscidefendens]